jgi:hypothetical protein
MLLKHVAQHDSDVGEVEGIGALNFLEIDDVSVIDEGTPVDPASVVRCATDVDLPRLPDYSANIDDPFLQTIHASGRKWVILADLDGEPQLLLDSDAFLRAVLLEKDAVDPYRFCHRPILVKNPKTNLGSVIRLLRRSKQDTKGVIENDVVLVWTDRPRIITGADLFDRLLHGIR